MAAVPETVEVERLLARHPARAIAAGAGTISYREAGHGAALVLLHGIGSASGSWLHQLDALSARFRVLAWDAPGYGGSTPFPEESADTGHYAQALASFADVLRLERLVLVGQSLGALIAARFARLHASRLRGLVLLSPARGHARLESEVRRRRLEERLSAMAELGPGEHARRRYENQLSAGASEAARALVLHNMSGLQPGGYAQAARLLAAGDIEADLPRYAGPLLVASGSVDRITPQSECQEIARLVPGAEFRSLGPVGHASYAEDPARVNALLGDFMASVPA
jgi:pimeloyl-ACP methyl ester carboxylesterase